MKKSKAVLDFIAYSVNDKVEFYRNAAIQLADVSTFPMIEVPITTINAVVDAFEAAVLAAKDGAHTAIALRNDQEQIADDLFRLLVTYVNKVANGDETIILKSGFHVSQQPIPFVKPDIAVNDGSRSGGVVVILKAVLGAVAYVLQYRHVNSLGELVEWGGPDVKTITHFDIDGLIPGAKYEFRFASISSAGTSDFSAAISKIVI